MSSKVYIVGIGPGNKDYILPKAVNILEKCNVIIGFERALESLAFIHTGKIVVKKFTEIIDFINLNIDKEISIVASGDPLFYGITDFLKKNYLGSIEIVPGISSFQYLMAKIGLSWQGSFLGSLHGREEAFCDIVMKNSISIWLTDTKHSPSYMCNILEKNKVKVNIYVGENLSYEDEKITIGNIDEIKNMDFGSLCVVVIENLI
jgi:cobalt-precorrin-7 (C5)-methyltransferase